ncbi:glycosyltransferase [Marinobacter salinisoli]|uniref:Glycosyltransferase n=1 Tax=Marinobacter salinisoli TaxID=2769486 RepID=A0ABX7MQJ8_9GAMM|nr:glycosyltransferase family 4 protein [Marinobacter salinisoli]QSP93674.1 glycosyltransferase [Marinobacter salinisoli]
MRILWLSHLIPYPPKGGVLQRSYNLLKEVCKQHEVTLFAFNQSDFLRKSLPVESDPVGAAVLELKTFVESVTVMTIPEEQLKFGRYRTALKALFSGNSYNMAWLRSREAAEALSELVENRAFDAVHIDTISLCVYWDIVSHLPVFLNHHNFESRMLLERSKSESNPLKKIYFREEGRRLSASERAYCELACLNICCSDDDAEDMKNIFPKGSFVTIPNGVDISYFYSSQDVTKKPNTAVIVGGLSWYPNRKAVEFFISDIWPILKERIPEFRVDIIGRDPTKEMVELSKKENNIHVHGFVDDVRKYLWESEFYLCPIKVGGGTKLKILDALATGCCIIADPFACKGINVTDSVNVIFAETAEGYVDKILELRARQSLMEAITENGPRLIADRYDYEKIGKDYCRYIQEYSSCAGLSGGSQ